MKNKDKIFAFARTNKNVKRLRKPVRERVDEALLRWFEYQRSNNIPISGPILQTRAEEFAKLFNDDEFKCTAGWLHRFKKRHNISASYIHGESANVNLEESKVWVQSTLSGFMKDYDINNIFNADETGLFYKLTPNRTLKFKGQKCVGGKQSKVRLTVMVCANMAGTEKRKLFVIGKFKNPRCFKHIKQLPCTYTANRRAWMTSKIFEDELRSWDKELTKQKRKILLLVDNCPAHPRISDLENIRLEFLPPNSTSVLQPMDQGIIHTLKSYYRRLLVMKHITNLDNEVSNEINLLEAMEMLAKAWQQISQETIKNCFQHAWKIANGFDEDDDLPLSQWLLKYNDNVNEDNLPLSVWLQNNLQEPSIVNLETIDEFASVDDNLITSSTPNDTDFVEEVLNQEDNSDDNEVDEEEETAGIVKPSYEDALKGIRTVTRYLETEESTTNKILNSALGIEHFLESISFKKSKRQTLVTEFFAK